MKLLHGLISKKIITVFLGLIDENIYYAIDLNEEINENSRLEERLLDAKFIDLRSIAPSLNNKSAGVIAQAKSIFEWNKSVIYCSKCMGIKLEVLDSGYKKNVENVRKNIFQELTQL